MPRSFLIRKSTTKGDSEDQESSHKHCLLPVSSSHQIESNVIQNAPESSGRARHCRGFPTTVDDDFIISDVAATTEINTSQKCTQFACTLCCRAFNRASDLKRHQLAHVEAKPYLCQICDRQFTWLGNFQKHYATHSQQQSCFSFFEGTPLNVLRSSPSSIFYEGPSFSRVPVCYGNIQRETVPREENQNNTPQSLICNVCSLTFTTTRALKMHTRIHTGVKPYKCSQCDKAFARKDELHTHKYSHTGEKPFKCDKCSASFVRFGHLQRHKFVHYDVKPYQCKVCPKSFTQYRNLQTHMYKHTGERPFKCKYCPKGFTQYGTLQAHERIHTGERPFTCNLCQRRFITSSHLRWHVRTQH